MEAKFKITGIITEPCELKTVGDKGYKMTTLSIMSEDKKNVRHVYKVTLWGKTAVDAGSSIKKGYEVEITGDLTTSTWADKSTGVERVSMKLVGQTVQIKNASAKATEPEDYFPMDEDDLPF
jgi:single-stranded DNA-binding protein